MSDSDTGAGVPGSGVPVARVYAFLVAFGIVSIVLPILYLQKPLHFDEAIYIAVAERVADGGLLYRDAIDHKPPGIFAVAVAGTAFADLARPVLVGVPGFPDPPLVSMAVLRLWTYAVVGLTGLSVAVLGRRVADATTGMAAGIVYVLLAYLPYFQGYYFLTEQWAILPTTVAALLLLHRRPWADGLAGGTLAVGVLFNQTVFLFGLAFVVYQALRFRDPDLRSGGELAESVRRVALIGAGFLVSLAAVFVAFAARGTLGDMLYFTVVLPATSYDTPVTQSGRGLAAVSLLPVIVLAGGVVTTLGRDLLVGADVDTDLQFVALWGIAVSYPGATSFDAQHQLLFVFPSLAVLATVGWKRMVDAGRVTVGADGDGPRWWAGWPRSFSAVPVVLVALVLVTASFNGLLIGSIVAGSHVDEQVEATRSVESRVDGAVYTWPPNLYLVHFSEGLQYGSRYYMGVYGPIVDLVIADLEQRAVPYLVVRADQVTDDGEIDPARAKWFVDDTRPLVAYMNREYEPVDRTETYVIFRRIDGQ